VAAAVEVVVGVAGVPVAGDWSRESKGEVVAAF